MLSERDQIFCEKCASGLMSYEAYLEAGFKCTSNESAQAAASRKLKEPGIKEEIRKIRERLCDENCLTMREKRLRLAEIARGKAFFSGGEFLFDVPPTHAERMKAKVNEFLHMWSTPEDLGLSLAEKAMRRTKLTIDQAAKLLERREKNSWWGVDMYTQQTIDLLREEYEAWGRGENRARKWFEAGSLQG